MVTPKEHGTAGANIAPPHPAGKKRTRWRQKSYPIWLFLFVQKHVHVGALVNARAIYDVNFIYGWKTHSESHLQ